MPLIGSVVISAEVFRDRSVRMHDGGALTFPNDIKGQMFSSVRRRGKFLWLPLSAPENSVPASALLVHFGMSGQLRLNEIDADHHQHLRVKLVLQSNIAAQTRLDFIDQRTFGHLGIVDLVPTLDSGELVPAPAAHIARDALDYRLDIKSVVNVIRRKNTEIKRVLLDQTVLSGIGNIYADEALWMAKIHPQTTASTLSSNQTNVIIKSAKMIMEKSIISGGTSFDALYVNVNGESGRNTKNLAVYGRAGQPCQRCGSAIERIVFMNRSSHLCPTCQQWRSR